MIYLIIAAVASFSILLYLVLKQEKENKNTSVQTNEWKDTFGGPVDWDQH